MNVLPTITVEAMADPHVHLREGPAVMADLIRLSLDGGSDVLGPMPNTSEPLTDARKATQYIAEARRLVPIGRTMEFIPIVQITESTRSEDIVACADAGILDFKIYPRFRTTNSEHGVVNYYPVISQIREAAEMVRSASGRFIRIHLHPEHPSMAFDNRDAEYCFLPIAYMLIQSTKAVVVWEHGTDHRCIRSWEELARSQRFYVTITAHHLATWEDQVFGDPRGTCKPPIKLREDRDALVRLVTQDFGWVMAGSDTAPHDESKKFVYEGQCACGAFTAPFLLPLYVHVLEDLFRTPVGHQTFRNFTSRNARFIYQLPPPSRAFTLVQEPFTVPLTYSVGAWKVQSFWAGKKLNWSLLV